MNTSATQDRPTSRCSPDAVASSSPIQQDHATKNFDGAIQRDLEIVVNGDEHTFYDDTEAQEFLQKLFCEGGDDTDSYSDYSFPERDSVEFGLVGRSLAASAISKLPDQPPLSTIFVPILPSMTPPPAAE